jgi:hypothetical protein
MKHEQETYDLVVDVCLKRPILVGVAIGSITKYVIQLGSRALNLQSDPMPVAS